MRVPARPQVPDRRGSQNALLLALLPLLPPCLQRPVSAEPRPAVIAVPPAQGSDLRPFPPSGCAPVLRRDPVPGDSPLLPPRSAAAADGDPAGPVTASPDYRHLLATTAQGHPRLARWCLWIEPSGGGSAAAIWDTRWRLAIDRALAQWQALLPITLVEDPSLAQVLVWRRRPPLAPGPDGRPRASHGRATLALQRVRRADGTRLEPSVQVLVSPAQRELAIEATALHELGHAFGLWGHSDDPADAMAAVPGARPVLTLSRRDRATLAWLYGQPTGFGQPLPP